MLDRSTKTAAAWGFDGRIWGRGVGVGGGGEREEGMEGVRVMYIL